jgi:hypothetical protein
MDVFEFWQIMKVWGKKADYINHILIYDISMENLRNMT